MTRMPDSAVIVLADYILADRVPIPGVLGVTDAANCFADYWTRKTGRGAHPKMRERIYECTHAIPWEYASGCLRPATADDEAILSKWCVQFCLDAQIAEETAYFKAQLPRKIAEQSLFVWEDNEIVSMAAIEREISHGVAISWVYTPLYLRRSGYATSCVAALTKLMLESGKRFCCLYTDLANPTSNSIYQKIGYQPVCDVQDWIFE